MKKLISILMMLVLVVSFTGGLFANDDSDYLDNLIEELIELEPFYPNAKEEYNRRLRFEYVYYLDTNTNIIVPRFISYTFIKSIYDERRAWNPNCFLQPNTYFFSKLNWHSDFIKYLRKRTIYHKDIKGVNIISKLGELCPYKYLTYGDAAYDASIQITFSKNQARFK